MYREKDSGSACQNCETGQYRQSKAVVDGVPTDTDQTTCVKCPSGWSADAGSTKCQPCEAGTYRNDELDTCQDCKAGQYRQSKEDDEWTITMTDDVTASAGVTVTQTV